MIPCFCINDKNKPAQVPKEKWVVQDERYHITYVTRVLPQNVLAYFIYEKPLTEDCLPFEFFLSTRFALTKENCEKVMQMYRELGELISGEEMKELFENSNLQTA